MLPTSKPRSQVKILIYRMGMLPTSETLGRMETLGTVISGIVEEDKS